MQAYGWTKAEVLASLAGVMILGGLVVWIGAYAESMTLALLLVVVLALLGVALRVTTVLFTPAAAARVCRSRSSGTRDTPSRHE